MKWVTTSWTYSILKYIKYINNKKYIHMVIVKDKIVLFVWLSLDHFGTPCKEIYKKRKKTQYRTVIVRIALRILGNEMN